MNIRRSAGVLLSALLATLACTGAPRAGGAPPTPVVDVATLSPSPKPSTADPNGPLARWQLVLDRPLPSKYEGLAFPDSLHGWVISDKGDILATTDGGNTWVTQKSGLPGLRSVDFLDIKHGFAGTLSGKMYETTDAGTTWAEITSRFPKTPIGFCGINHLGNTVYVVGRYIGAADYFVSSDGGKTWEYRDLSEVAQGLVDVNFLNPSVGLIAGMSKGLKNLGHAVILKTNDGGKHWRKVFHLDSARSDSARSWSWKIFPVSPKIIYVALENMDGNYRVMKSMDAGDTWKLQIVATGQGRNGGVQGIGFLDTQRGWVGGFFTGMFATTDGGEHWVPVNIPSIRINKFRRSGSTLVTAGSQGILRYELPRP